MLLFYVYSILFIISMLFFVDVIVSSIIGHTNLVIIKVANTEKPIMFKVILSIKIIFSIVGIIICTFYVMKLGFG